MAEVSSMALSRKQPRDFVYLDEFWPADANWSHYYLDDQVWVYLDEYRAELIGDGDYCRIIINAGNDYGWIYKRNRVEKAKVLEVLGRIQRPVSEVQLQEIGFTRWSDGHIY
jgi:hypothetical protein